MTQVSVSSEKLTPVIVQIPFSWPQMHLLECKLQMTWVLVPAAKIFGQKVFILKHNRVSLTWECKTFRDS